MSEPTATEDRYEERWRRLLDSVAELEREPPADTEPEPQLSLFDREPAP